MVTGNTPQPSGLFGVHLQAGDLDRSLMFYRDVLALEVVWNDGALAVLHGHRAPADSLVIREIGKAARHNMGEARVTPVLWRARNPAELDSAEELLRRQQVVGAESLCHLGGCPAASGAGLAGAGPAGGGMIFGLWA
jgi:catechol-2,3-dioxygenase